MRIALFALFLVTAGGVSACSSAATTSTGTDLSALTATDADGGVPATLAPCLTTYVECLRATPGDAATCQSALRACVGAPHPEGDGGAPGCNHGGGPGGGHDGPGGPPRGHGPDGDADDDGGLPPPPPDGGPAPGAGGPRACLDALDTCAAGADTSDTCVAAAVACLEALPRPPHRDHR